MTEMSDTAKAYWAKPYAVRIETSHFSGTFMFDDAEKALKYLFNQFARVEQIIATREYGNAWVNFDCRRSYFSDRRCIIPASYILNVQFLASDCGIII